jgi:hypothetical protein
MNIRITPTLITAYTALATFAIGLIGYSTMFAGHKESTQKRTAIESLAKPEPERIAIVAITDKERSVLQ